MLKPLLPYLQKGVTPHKLALTVVLGLLFGIFPVIGTCTLLCTIVAFTFRLNIAVIQLVNYLVYPLQLVLLLPFIRTGEMVFQKPTSILSIDYLIQVFSHGWWKAIVSLQEVLWFGLVGWIMIAIPLAIVAFYLCYSIFKRIPVIRNIEENDVISSSKAV